MRPTVFIMIANGVRSSSGRPCDSRSTDRAGRRDHSIPVDVELEEKTPPDILWHGTGEKYVSSIDEQGLIPKSRLYVHLSSDVETAKKVGSRHGKPVIYQVDCRKMTEDGFRFYLSANKVWLTKVVPPQYLSKEKCADGGRISCN